MAVAPALEALIVDCSVLVKWELPGEVYATEAMALFSDWQAGAVSVHAPDLLPSEIGGAFLRAVRRGRVTEAQARVSIEGLLRFPYVLYPSVPLVDRAFEIAHRHGQRIYDCFYVALAEREGLSFWTGDERLYNALRAHHPCVCFIAGYAPRQ
jgi:predicted nucleic acid-binding protein